MEMSRRILLGENKSVIPLTYPTRPLAYILGRLLMKQGKLNYIAVLLIVIIASVYIYFYEFTVLANSTEFEVSNLEIQDDHVNLEVQAVNSEIVFKKFRFDTYNNELQIGIEKVRKDLFQQNKSHGVFNLSGHDGYMKNIDRILIKYKDKDVIVWEKDE